MTIDEEIEQIRRWRDRQSEWVSAISNETYQRILLVACIDAFAQHQDSSDLIKGKGNRILNQKNFSSFLQHYIRDDQRQKWMGLVCPTTLFYDYQDEFKNTTLNLVMEEMRIYAADDAEAMAESERLIKCLPENKREHARAKHQYSALIYQMRNKLVHEMMLVGCQASFYTEDSDPVPHMVVLNKRENNELIPYKWTLHIPVKLIWNCFMESSENYLNECQKQQKHPLGNYDPNQKSTFAFYE